MKAALIALTIGGKERAGAIARFLPEKPDIFLHEHCSPDPDKACSFRHLRDLVPGIWEQYRLFIFIMATGIVVRQIAPLIRSKDRDPAVIAGDEAGKFLIPLLSGHLGGANAWAEFLAEKTGALAIITTATDVNGWVAPDEYARRLGWQVTQLPNLPAVNRHLVEKGYLTVVSEFQLPLQHPLRRDPSYLFLSEDRQDQRAEGTDILGERITGSGIPAQVIISAFPKEASRQIYLIPPAISIGVGCRRGVSANAILQGIEEVLRLAGTSRLAVKGLYSIELKAGEPGLQEAAKHLGVPFITFPADTIQRVNEQRGLSQSDFVRKTIGVDGVCEAASLLGTVQGVLILPKFKMGGVTLALSLERSLLSASAPEIPNI